MTNLDYYNLLAAKRDGLRQRLDALKPDAVTPQVFEHVTFLAGMVAGLELAMEKVTFPELTEVNSEPR